MMPTTPMMPDTLPVVIKIGGNEMDRPGFFDQLAQAVATVQQQTPCILVHGGGQAINRLQARLGLQAVYHNGQRVTDAPRSKPPDGALRWVKQIVLALRAGWCDRHHG